MNKYLITGTTFLVTIAACDTAFERNLEGKTVTLQAPVNNLLSGDTIQTFYWDHLDGANEYQLQVVSPRFGSIVRLVVDTIITRNQFTMDLDTGRYQWRVRGQNNSSISDAGTARNLQIQ